MFDPKLAIDLWNRYEALLNHMRQYMEQWTAGTTYPSWVGQSIDVRRRYDWCREWLRLLPTEDSAFHSELAAIRRVALQWIAGPPYAFDPSEFVDFSLFMGKTLPGWREDEAALHAAILKGRRHPVWKIAALVAIDLAGRPVLSFLVSSGLCSR